MEKGLGRIAEDAFESSARSACGPALWEETAAAVEKAVLARLGKDEWGPIAGQELTIGQAAKIAEDNGSTDILEYFNDDLSRFMPCGYNNCIYLGSRYRVAPKKANYPDDVKVLPMDEYKALIENQMPSMESFEAGQELNNYQVLKWIEKYGSASGLQYMYLHEWADCEGTPNNVIDTQRRYRVAPKNDPDDPATWEKGVAIFRRDAEDATWILDVFRCYKKNLDFKYATNVSSWRYAKLATPEQIEAWKLINDDL